MLSTNKRKLRASLTERILSSEWFLNSSEFMAAREDLLQDDLDHSGLSIVFTEREINALAFLYSKRIFDKRRLDGCMEILFSTASEDSCCIQHHRLISLVERGCDFTRNFSTLCEGWLQCIFLAMQGLPTLQNHLCQISISILSELKFNHFKSTCIKWQSQFYACWVIWVVGPNLEIPFWA